jgi:heptosyltransferase-2/heptosyltransferase-3
LAGDAKLAMRHALVLAFCGRTALANASRRRTQFKIEQTGRVLVIRPDHLGDLLFATPTLDVLKHEYAFGKSQVTGAVGPWGRAMWEDNPNLDALLTLPFPGIAGKPGGNPLAPYLLLNNVARRLARERYDLGIVLRFDHWWGAALLWAAGIPLRHGYDTPGMKPWLNRAVPYAPGQHEVQQDLRLAFAVTASTALREKYEARREKGQPPLRPPCPNEPTGDVVAGWADAPRRAVIHPGTGAANKLWTVAGWAEVARRLTADGWAVALTGAPGERALTEAIASAAGGDLPNIAGRTADLHELAWVLGRAQMVLGVDSGPLHIAAALDKPTLHLYGPSDERIWGPWGDPLKHRALRAPGTRPSMRLDVGAPGLEGGPEMRSITVEMVMGAIGELARFE